MLKDKKYSSQLWLSQWRDGSLPENVQFITAVELCQDHSTVSSAV
jgi:hypothetical protein